MGTRAYIGIGTNPSEPTIACAVYIHWGGPDGVIPAIYELCWGINRRWYKNFYKLFIELASKYTYYSSLNDWDGDPDNRQDSSSFSRDSQQAYLNHNISFYNYARKSKKLIHMKNNDIAPISHIDLDIDIEYVYLWYPCDPQHLHIYEVVAQFSENSGTSDRVYESDLYDFSLVPYFTIILG